MKKIIVFTFLITLMLTKAYSQAEDYRAFKVDVGGLYARPTGEGVKLGFGWYVEPKYNFTNNIAGGIKYEQVALMAADDLWADVSITGLTTTQLTCDYYFSENFERFFLGLGMGFYDLGIIEYDYSNSTDFPSSLDDETDNIFKVDYGTKFGVSPRIGLVMGHFRVAMEYNIVTGIEEGLERRNYAAFKIGIEIGGGYK